MLYQLSYGGSISILFVDWKFKSDSNFQVFEAASSKTEALKQANSTMTEAKAAVKRVLETIELGKKSEITAQNIALQAADEVNLSVANCDLRWRWLSS